MRISRQYGIGMYRSYHIPVFPFPKSGSLGLFHVVPSISSIPSLVPYPYFSFFYTFLVIFLYLNLGVECA